MSFALFWLGEYGNVILMCALNAILFWGGFLPPLNVDLIPWFDIPGILWLFLKMSIFFFIFSWVRATVPRYRYDQLMRLGWKIFLPLSLLFVVLVSGWLMLTRYGVLGLPPSMNNWKFDLSLRPGDDGTDVTLNWPGDPIRAGKALAALSIGPHDYSFVSVHAGPCLFTKTSCIFLYTVSEQADGSADILIQLGALNSDGDRSKPFQAFMAGRCSPKVAAK
jgi:hypothetical protein